MKRTTEAVTIALEVNDRGVLYQAALKRAIAEGETAQEYQERRRNDPAGPVGVDLITLLDPGSLAGCDILESSLGDSYRLD